MQCSHCSYRLLFPIVLTSPSEIGVGLCHEASPYIGMPGWKKGSWAYHGDDGNLFLESGQGVQFGDTFGAGDVIGCGSNMDNDEFFFTKNGTRVGELRQYSLVHKPNIDRSRIRKEIASREALSTLR